MPKRILTGIIVVAIALAPGYAAACACCGLDNWWSANDRKIEGFYEKLLAGLTLVNGEFNDSPGTDYYYQVSKIKRNPHSFAFETEIGLFEFRFGDTFEHRASDITFITQPKYNLDNVADIYHEIILRGTLKLPKKAASISVKNPVPATMIFQGLGGVCVEADLFKKWILRIESADLKAFGKLEGRQPNSALQPTSALTRRRV
jgi:hypothetical protein